MRSVADLEDASEKQAVMGEPSVSGARAVGLSAARPQEAQRGAGRIRVVAERQILTDYAECTGQPMQRNSAEISTKRASGMKK